MLAKTPEDGANLMLSVALETGPWPVAQMAGRGLGGKRWAPFLKETTSTLVIAQPYWVPSILKGLVVCPYRDRYVVHSWFGLAFSSCKATAKTHAGAYRMPDPQSWNPYSKSANHGSYFTEGKLALLNLDIFLKCIVKCKEQDLEKYMYSMVPFLKKGTMTTLPYMCMIFCL